MAEKYAPFPGAVCLEPGSELWEKILGKKDSGDDSDSDFEMEPNEEEQDELMKQYKAYLKQWDESELRSLRSSVQKSPILFVFFFQR